MITEVKSKYVPEDFVSVTKDYIFSWDDNKSEATFRDRGLRFDVATHIFENVRIECPDYGEVHFDDRDSGERIYTIGKLRGKRGETDYLVVIFIEESDTKARIISARYAQPNERRCYLEYC